MGKKLLLAAAVSMTLVANAGRSPYQGKNYLDWGKLKLVGNQLSDKDGNPVQLKGWSTQSLHTKSVAGCIGQGQWNLMKQYGANIVRLAMYIDDPNDGGSYIAKPDYFKDLIKQSIAETKALDMYCIVDWHTTPDSLLSGDPNDYIAESKDFFGEISKYCADNGYDNVLYEICNESTCGWPNIKSYAEEVIPVITANQPDAIVVVGTDQWCQKILEPAFNPIDSTYKKNVMYSFHYDACSHYHLLGDFRVAQKNIPVFVSEWSAVKFDGSGPFCKENSDELISNCENTSAVAPQVVSWCIWNWGSKNEASSFFTDSCDPGNLSKYMDESGRKYSDYVIELMSGPQPHPCCTPPDGPWSTINTIPSTEASLWRWDYYNKGGEGYAYHDLNSTAYEKDDEGVVIGYSNNGEEVDVFSLAKKMQWMNKQCPWSTVEDGKVVAWDKSINTTWQDENENPTYKSLNAGRTYVGASESIRPDEGVDLLVASLNGTAHAGELYSNLGWVEEGEWINYTVNVNKPGYYKIKGIIGAEYREYTKNGEISIIQDGKNILRDTSALDDETTITSFGFPRTTKCDDPKADIDFTPWDCWTVSDAKSGRNKEVLCYFKEAGEQEITIVFNGNAGGVGPLIFDFYKELNPEDPYVCCGGIQTAVNTISSTESSLWHWDYYDNGGEGVAYHDLNSGAYEKDDDGVVIGYSNTGEEVDVFSLAKEMKWLDESCPWSTVKDGKVVAFDSIIATAWRDSSGKPTYRSLNAGRMYDGPDGSVRPDEGVDLCRALMNGTSHEGEGYTNLGWVEEGEWINYTVRVEKPGYYKIRGIVSAEYRGANRNGEISIASNGINLLRIPEHISDFDAITSFGFPITEKCDDRKVDASTEPWYCWTIADAKSGREKEVLCEFSEAGEQMINISFSGNAGGVGPLIFDWYSEVPEDPFICCDDPGDVNDVDAVKFSINPNPTSGEFNITLADKNDATVEVVNMAGQVVVSQKIVGSATINKILPAGVYTVVVKSNGAVNTQKLVVK